MKKNAAPSILLVFVISAMLISISFTLMVTAKKPEMVTICHIPPDNPEDAHPIKVSEKAIKAHLAHGDVTGECEVQDLDGDGVPDTIDNCLFDFNPGQGDIDHDKEGDACDTRYRCCFNDFINDPRFYDNPENCIDQFEVSECHDTGGIVNQCIMPEKTGKVAPTVNVSVRRANRTALSGFLQNLTDAVDSTGVNNTPYNATTYDCDDFANDLERNLTALGYNATYTVYWCYNALGATTTAHAVTDVHAPDGSIIFIEPQSGRIINNDLDFDNDGNVEYRTHHSNPRSDTDDMCEIEVFEDVAAATAAGAPRD
jgi:hypothetical protein